MVREIFKKEPNRSMNPDEVSILAWSHGIAWSSRSALPGPDALPF